MRDLFEDIFKGEPRDPMEAARRAMRPPLRKRFFEQASAGEEEHGAYPVLLDRRLVRTPGRRTLALPSRPLAEAVAAEWDVHREAIDPAAMPLTRLANTIIDGVADTKPAVAADIEKYLGSDLLFYRAAEPDGLVALQAQHWDPVLAWAREAFGARFILSEGVMFVAQPPSAIAAMRLALPADAWRLGALHAITTLTGSAVLALAVLHGRLSAEEAWAAAHIDEDWNMAQWGRDELAMQRRAFRWGEMRAAAAVIELAV